MHKTKELIIETKNLGFGFNKKEKILKNVNLKVEKGSIYGFLGPNGAGKTTTIRLLLGLLKAPENQIKLFCKNLSADRTEILSKTGSLIEHPSLYEHISGYDNLKITRLIRKTSKKKIADVLDLMNLSGVAGKKVSEYSMGMKQRLGIAIALLGNPELLILDEPVNGLDPNGIVEIRELLKNLNKESGVTIFLSSHLLSEIGKIATHIGIINMGEIKFQGTISELMELQNVRFCLHLETSNNRVACELLQPGFPVHNNGSELLVTCGTKEQVAQIIIYLVNDKIDIYKAYSEDKDLEQLFLGLTVKPNVSGTGTVASLLSNI
jgi:lantibiotic transport system ATP-binding protein